MVDKKVKSVIESLNFDILNEVLKKNVKNRGLIKLAEDGARIILLNSKNIPYNIGLESPQKVTIEESINIIVDFLGDIDEKYIDKFLALLKKFDFEGNQTRTFIQSKKCTIVIKENVFDAFKILHESMHLISIENNSKLTLSQGLLAEIPSIFIEFVLYDYLKNKSCSKELNQVLSGWIDYRFYMTYSDSCKIFIEHQLLELYLQNGNKLDADILYKYLISVDMDENLNSIIEWYFIFTIEIVIKNQKMSFFKGMRYVFGLLYASYFIDKLSKNNFDVKNIFDLNSILGEESISLKSATLKLQQYGIMLIKTDEQGNVLIGIDDEENEKLIDSYKKLYNMFYEQQEMNPNSFSK